MRIVILLLCCCQITYGQSEKFFSIYSEFVKDSFDISVTSLNNNGGKITTVYYLDADLYSGKILRGLLAENFSKLNDLVFIGIANRGRTEHQFRKRDYIPPVLRNGDTLSQVIARSSHYGHADRFYLFLSSELIPLIEKNIKVNNNRTIIGHSLGGLFVFYCLFKTERLFKNHISISPGLWVNKYNIFEYEKKFSKSAPEFDNYLYLSSGKKEFFNFVLKGNRRMKKNLVKRNYKGLRMDYAEHSGKKHDTQVPVSLNYILKNLF